MILEPAVAVTPIFTWVEPTGVEHDLTVLVGLDGGLLPEVDVALRASPFRQGSTVQSARLMARRLRVPLFFREVSDAALRDKVRQVARWFNPTATWSSDATVNPGTWKFTAVDGTVRTASAVYAGGLEGPEGPGGLFAAHWIGVAEFILPHPYWRDVDDVEEAFTIAGATVKGLFDPPFFPIRLTTSNVVDLRLINNDGDADAWPRWTVTGPLTRVTLRNGTNALTVTTSLAATRQILIDTTPGVKTITDEYGNNLYQVSDGPLWPLAPGVNRVQVEADGATTDTRIDLAYRREWLTP